MTAGVLLILYYTILFQNTPNFNIGAHKGYAVLDGRHLGSFLDQTTSFINEAEPTHAKTLATPKQTE